MDLSDLKKFPINTRGYTVIPCILLTRENMHESMIGLKVTIGLETFDYGVTDAGEIVGFDEEKLHIKVGAKIKKFEYDPQMVELQVYQFDKRILFSNERVSEKELASSHKNHYNGTSLEASIPSYEKKEADNELSSSLPEKKESVKKQTPKKKPKPAKKEPSKETAQKSSGYVPKFGIQWG